jgi:hypothetical protein
VCACDILLRLRVNRIFTKLWFPLDSFSPSYMVAHSSHYHNLIFAQNITLFVCFFFYPTRLRPRADHDHFTNRLCVFSCVMQQFESLLSHIHLKVRCISSSVAPVLSYALAPVDCTGSLTSKLPAFLAPWLPSQIPISVRRVLARSHTQTHTNTHTHACTHTHTHTLTRTHTHTHTHTHTQTHIQTHTQTHRVFVSSSGTSTVRSSSVPTRSLRSLRHSQ